MTRRQFFAALVAALIAPVVARIMPAKSAPAPVRIQDDNTGINIRMVNMYKDGQRIGSRFDILSGVSVMHPEFTCRAFG